MTYVSTVSPDTLVTNNPVSCVFLYTNDHGVTNNQGVVQGFGLGANLGSVNLVGGTGIGGVLLTGVIGSTSLPATLTNPFDGLQDPSGNILVRSGFGLTGQGTVLRYNAPIDSAGVANSVIDLVASAGVGPLTNPTFVLATDANTVFVSEYAGVGAGGQVRKFVINGNLVTQSVFLASVTNPAGLASDGTYLYVCSSGATGIGKVYKVPLTATGANGATASTIQAPSPGFNYPWRVAVDGAGGVLVGQGFFIDNSTGISFGSAGPFNGGLYYVTPAQSSVAQPSAALVMGGIGPVAGMGWRSDSGQTMVSLSEGVNGGSVRQVNLLQATAEPVQHLVLATNLLFPVSAPLFPATTVLCPSIKVGVHGGVAGQGAVNQYTK